MSGKGPIKLPWTLRRGTRWMPTFVCNNQLSISRLININIFKLFINILIFCTNELNYLICSLLLLLLLLLLVKQNIRLTLFCWKRSTGQIKTIKWTSWLVFFLLWMFRNDNYFTWNSVTLTFVFMILTSSKGSLSFRSCIWLFCCGFSFTVSILSNLFDFGSHSIWMLWKMEK